MRRDPVPALDALLAVYRADEYFSLGERRGIGYADYYADESVYRPYFRRKLRDLARFRAPPGQLLEIGAAAGYALDEARRLGWTVRGLELSAAAVRFARDVLTLPMEEGTLDDLGAGAEFDVVVAFQTLEHVSDPRGALRSIREALRPSGLVLLTTPDHDSWVRKIFRRYWPSYRPEHLVYFDPRTLSRLLKEEGFAVELLAPDGALWVPLDRVVERLSHYYGLRRARARVPRWRLPVWLGDMEVIARRRA